MTSEDVNSAMPGGGPAGTAVPAGPVPGPPYRYTVTGLIDGDSAELLVAAVFDGEHVRVDVGSTLGYERVALVVDADNRVQAERFAALLVSLGSLPVQASADQVEAGDTLVYTLSRTRRDEDDPREAVDTDLVDRVGRDPEAGDVLLWAVDQDDPAVHDPSDQLWVVRG